MPTSDSLRKTAGRLALAAGPFARGVFRRRLAAAAGLAVVATTMLVVLGLRFGAGDSAAEGPESAARVAGSPASVDDSSSMAGRRIAVLERRVAYERKPTQRATEALAGALSAAGQYEELRALADDPQARFRDAAMREAFRLEADFRGRRFDEARVRAQALLDGPYRAQAALALAEIGYRLDPRGGDALVENIRIALGGVQEVAAQAWLLRARMALDAGAFDFAQSAARRAREAGAAPSRVEAVRIEAMIRQGRLAEADALLTKRLAASGDSGADADALRLRGVSLLRQGEYKAAVQVFEAIDTALENTPRGELLRAVAKLGAGDLAVASRLVDAVIRVAPFDWVAWDVKALVADAWRERNGPSESHVVAALDGLEAAGAGRLAHLRRQALARRRGDRSDAFALIAAAADAPPAFSPDRRAPKFVLTGIEFLIGPASVGDGAGGQLGGIERLLDPVDVGHAAALKAAADVATASPSPSDPSGSALVAGGDGLALALAGETARRRGEVAAAVDLLLAAAAADPGLDGVAERLWLAARDARHAPGSDAARRVIETLQSLARARPNDVDAHVALATALRASGDVGAAANALSAVEAEFVADPSHADRFADTLLEAGRVKDLIAFAARLERNPVDGAAAAAGRAFASAGRAEDAARAFRVALGRDPADQAAADGYLDAMTDLGLRDAGEALLAYIRSDGQTPSAAGAGLQTIVTPLGYQRPELRAPPAGAADALGVDGDARQSARKDGSPMRSPRENEDAASDKTRSKTEKPGIGGRG